MHPLQQEKIERLQRDITSLATEEHGLLSALIKSIEDNEPFSTILCIAMDYRINGFRSGYTQAEIIHTKFPSRYEN